MDERANAERVVRKLPVPKDPFRHLERLEDVQEGLEYGDNAARDLGVEYVMTYYVVMYSVDMPVSALESSMTSAPSIDDGGDGGDEEAVLGVLKEPVKHVCCILHAHSLLANWFIAFKD